MRTVVIEVNRDTVEGRDRIAAFAIENPDGVMVKSPRSGNFAYLFRSSTEYNQWLNRTPNNPE
jgi:hypothetical protein